MTKIQKRLGLNILLVCFLLTLAPVNVLADNSPLNLKNDISKSSIASRAERKGYKYKMMNGRQYKRLWSYTKNKWLEPIWTPV